MHHYMWFMNFHELRGCVHESHMLVHEPYMLVHELYMILMLFSGNGIRAINCSTFIGILDGTGVSVLDFHARDPGSNPGNCDMKVHELFDEC